MLWIVFHLLLLVWLNTICSFSLISFNHRNSWRFVQTKISCVNQFGDKLKVNQMSIDELKAELDLRKVDYIDCISKQELVERLVQSRATGKTDPELLNKFNANANEGSEINLNEIDDSLLDETVAKDGTLPGGLSKEMLKALSTDKELMNMIKDVKMQEIMKAVMSGGPEAMKKYLYDPDAVKLLERLSLAMKRHTEKN